MTTLALTDLTTGQEVVVEVGRVLVAGFTGRDAAAVAEHVEELAAEGVPVPDRTPSLYRLDAHAVRQTTEVVVAGPETSGEVEPVVLVAGGQRYLAVGSDHTDRALEREDIGASKAACPKPIGTTCLPLEEAEGDWDAIELRSTIDGSTSYQDGTLASLLRLDDLLEHLERTEDVELRDGDVLYLGTIPAIGGIRPAASFAASLVVPVGHRLELSYRVTDLSSTGRSPLRKPEHEFFDVADVPWTPIPGGVEGQTERILAADPTAGVATRMLRFKPGTDTTELGVVRHDFWEEVFILEGELHDLTLDRVFPAGTYACRPPGMPHGPWRSEPGCVTFEVRYPAM